MSTHTMLLYLALLAGGAVSSQHDDFPIVDELDIPKYLGRWYQPYASTFVVATYIRNGVCVTATYGAINETTISVFNHYRKFEPNGTETSAGAVGFTTADPGKLLINFNGGDSGGLPYWVMKLGPVRTYDGVEQYSYSVVSEPNRRELYILCRDYEEYQLDFEEETLEFCFENGYNSTRNNPVSVYLGADCLYPDLPPEE